MSRPQGLAAIIGICWDPLELRRLRKERERRFNARREADQAIADQHYRQEERMLDPEGVSALLTWYQGYTDLGMDDNPILRSARIVLARHGVTVPKPPKRPYGVRTSLIRPLP